MKKKYIIFIKFECLGLLRLGKPKHPNINIAIDFKFGHYKCKTGVNDIKPSNLEDWA